MNMKRLLALGLSAAMTLCLAACGNNAKPGTDNDGVRPPDPFTEYESLEDAVKGAGFEFIVPDNIEDFDERIYRVNQEDGLIEVIFRNGDEEIVFRKASGVEDASGNYKEFSETEDVDIDGTTVTMKGADGKVSLAVWSKDGYGYSIDCTSAIEKVAMTDLIKTVNADGGLIGGDSNTQIPNPFIDCADMAEAAKLTGFDMSLPSTPDLIQAVESGMIQVFYGEEDSRTIIRKAVGSDDVSGDYTEYAQVETVDGVTLKGERDSFTLAIWNNDGYTYSISAGEAMSQTDIIALVAAIQ